MGAGCVCVCWGGGGGGGEVGITTSRTVKREEGWSQEWKSSRPNFLPFENNFSRTLVLISHSFPYPMPSTKHTHKRHMHIRATNNNMYAYALARMDRGHGRARQVRVGLHSNRFLGVVLAEIFVHLLHRQWLLALKHESYVKSPLSLVVKLFWGQ